MHLSMFTSFLMVILHAGRAAFIKPWKYTSPSTNHSAAAWFAYDYLRGADYSDYYFEIVDASDPSSANLNVSDDASCVEAEWLFWMDPTSKIDVAKPGLDTHFCKDFHMHFVSLRREGPLKQSVIEQMIFRASDGNTKYTAFMDTHVTFETSDLDPIAGPLLAHRVPVFGHINADGNFSIFVTIAHGPVVEITSPHFTLARLGASDPCMSGPARVTRVDWRRVHMYRDADWVRRQRENWRLKQPGQQWRFNHYLRTWLPVEWPPMRLKRMSFASTKPAAAAALMASVLDGEPLPELHVNNVTGGCLHTHSIRFLDRAGADFELAWVHRPAETSGSASLALLEQYILELRGNVSERNWRNWEHLMDYHAGLIFDDCQPILSRLKANSVEFFLAEQGGNDTFVSIFFQDGTGVFLEIVCIDWRVTNGSDLWKWRDFWFDRCELEPDPLDLSLSLRLTRLASKLSGRASTVSLSTYGEEYLGTWSLMAAANLPFILVLALIGAICLGRKSWCSAASGITVGALE
mmetsp:Transcript_159735/g.387878  ORF Transcript_159735/g.387878 Transcript_159735/m.387878 type:complete len:521 (-) Transcript_159735:156-1718(-)